MSEGLRIHEALEKVKKETGKDFAVVMGDDFTLTLDLDTPEAVDVFTVNLAILQQIEEISEMDRWASKNGVGVHIKLRTKYRYYSDQRAGIQALLGSDPKREALGYVNGRKFPKEEPFCLFKPKV
jgi:hypothetical protein